MLAVKELTVLFYRTTARQKVAYVAHVSEELMLCK